MFVDENLARQAGIPPVALLGPKTVLDLDGRLLVRVTHCTAPVTLLISGNHCVQIELNPALQSLETGAGSDGEVHQ